MRIRAPRSDSLLAMKRILEAPLRALGTLITVAIAGRVFELVWRLITRGQPVPDPQDRTAGTIAVVGAAALRSASKAATREVVDRAGRRTSSHLFGTSSGRSSVVPPAHPKAAKRAEQNPTAAKSDDIKQSRRAKRHSSGA